MRMLFSVMALCLAALPALAQTGAPTDCSGSVGTGSTPITFGTGGPSKPSLYVTVASASASGKLAVNPTGAAAIDTAGSFPMDSIGAGWTWSVASGYPPPSALNIVGNAGATPFTCKYQ